MMPWSPHARCKGAKRQIPQKLVDFALAWGEEIRQPGRRTAYHLGRKAIAKAREAKVPVPPRALGVAVIVAADHTVVTVLRSDDRHRLVLTGQRRRARRQS